MKFSVNTAALADGVGLAARAISGKSSLPVLDHVLVEAKTDDEGAGYLSLAGTNLEMMLQTRVPARVDEAGEVTLPAKLLGNLMSTWDGNAITEAELDEKAQTLHARCGGADAMVKGITAAEYPEIPDPSAWDRANLDPYDLRGAIDRVVISAAVDESRPILTGVYIHAEDDRVTFAAADGFRLSVVRIVNEHVTECESLKSGVIVPGQALRELGRMLPGAGQAVTLCIKPYDPPRSIISQVAFVVRDKDGKAKTVLTSQLIEGNFPDYTQIIPKSNSLTVRADVRALRNAVESAMVFATHSANIVEWRVGEQSLTTFGQSVEMGQQEARLDVEAEGAMPDYGEDNLGELRGEIAVNGAYVIDVLKVLDAAQVEVGLNTPSSPLVLRPIDGADFVHVIMPMHLER